jgi:hypothetical protein
MNDTMTEDRIVDASPSDTDAVPALHREHAWKRRRRAVRVYSVVTVVALAGIGWLGYQGYDASLKVKGGATATVITDPSAPGYVAAVDATPVHLIALTDDSDALSAFVVLVPDASGSGGSIIWSLGELVVDVDGTPTAITDVYKAEGLEGARAQFEKVLGFGATDATIIAPKDIAAIAAPLGTISIKNPDPVSVDQKGKRVVKFAAGTLELDPDEIGEYLTIRGAGEAPTNRGSRADIVLSALAAKLIDASDAGATSSSNSTAAGASTTAPAAADGSVDIGGVLASTGASPDFIVLPMTRQSFKGSYLYSPDADGITDQLAGVVQFPVSSFPGQRPRVRVLNGT